MNQIAKAALSESYFHLKRVDTSHLEWRIGVALVLIITGPTASIFSPVVLGDAVNLLSDQNLSPSWTDFLMLATFSIVLAAFSSCASNLRDLVFDQVIEDLKCRFSVSTMLHLFKLPYEFYARKQSGAVFRVVERGAGALEELIRCFAFNLVPTTIEFLLGFGVLVYKLDWGFGLAAGVGLFLYIGIDHWYFKQRILARQSQNELDNKIAALASDGLTNFIEVRLLGAEGIVTERHEAVALQYAAKAANSARILNTITFLQQFTMTVVLGVIVFMAGIGVLYGEYQIGDVLASIFIIRGLYFPLGALGYHFRSMQQSIIDLEHVLKLKNIPVALKRAENLENDVPVSPPLVSLSNVTVIYPGQSCPVIEKLSLCFSPGKRTAIVGPSGGGKSTILHLIAGLFEPDDGQVLFDGKSQLHASWNHFKSAIAVVPQDVSLFNDTLEMNLTLGCNHVSEDDIFRALSVVGLIDLIQRLPCGLQTEVGVRGVKLSGGERQRIGIARAILRNPKVLILDEATSSLDGNSELEIQRRLYEIIAEMTTIVVAHRLVTIADADWIYVLENGKVSQQGLHQDLLESNGYYQKAWAHQLAANSEGVETLL